MRYKNIITFFLIALPVSLVVRILQIIFTVDAVTGFFLQEYTVIGFIMSFIIVIAAATTAILGYSVRRSPETAPRPSGIIGVSAVLAAAGVAVELVTEQFGSNVRLWQMALLYITGIATVIFFILVCARAFFNIKIPPMLYIIPATYLIMRLVCAFISVSTLSIIFENILRLAVYSVMLLFTINLAKMMNGVDKERINKKLLSTGLISVLLGLVDCIPSILFLSSRLTGSASEASGKAVSLHTGGYSGVAVLGWCVFISVFMFSHFSIKNLRGKTHSHTRSRREPPDEGMFYVTPGKPPSGLQY